jgi:hypothetical protein
MNYKAIVFFLIGTLMLNAQKTKTIIIKNTLNVERTFETVELSRKCLGLKPTDNFKKYAIIKVGDPSNFLKTQCIDENKDGIDDVIIFQPKIAPLATEKYELVITDRQFENEEICYSRFVPERTDDYAWENNRVAFRTYGPTAQKMIEDNVKGGTLSSGIDAWLKKVEYPIINKWYKKHTEKTGSYHEDTGEGLDNFHVGVSRGIGGIAVKIDTSYYVSKNFVSWETITTGPLRTSFMLTYADWDAKGNKIKEKKKITLDYGNNFSKFEILISGTKKIAAGITLHDKKGEETLNSKEGWMSHWETLDDSQLGTALIVPKSSLIDMQKYITNTKDWSNLYANIKVNNQKVVYYSGFGSKKRGDFNTKADWEKFLSIHALKMNNPLKVKMK